MNIQLDERMMNRFIYECFVREVAVTGRVRGCHGAASSSRVLLAASHPLRPPRTTHAGGSPTWQLPDVAKQSLGTHGLKYLFEESTSNIVVIDFWNFYMAFVLILDF